MNPKVGIYLENLNQWQNELTKLRHIALDCGLTEAYKWMHPCYMHNKKNIVIIHEFNDYCGITFFKGVLLKDPKNILIQQTENIQSARQIRFTCLSEIETLQETIKQYIYEAIEIENAGLNVKLKKTSDYEMPEELKQVFKENTDFETAFNKLTEGRKRGYLLHFSKAKKPKSRLSRIDKNMERIFKGKGLTDCICGLSKRKPNCDGSHKQLESKQ